MAAGCASINSHVDRGIYQADTSWFLFLASEAKPGSARRPSWLLVVGLNRRDEGKKA
jgi:hypothetical protein